MADKNKFVITDTDKEWVHQNFEWLIKAYGYPSKGFKPVFFTDEFFPLTIGHKQTAVEPLLSDLCNLFDIHPSRISYVIEKDIRDTHGIPYEYQDAPFECDLEIIEQGDEYHYKLYFANNLLKRPKRLVFNAVFKLIQIHLGRTDIGWVNNEDLYFTFYLIGIYTGWGVVLAQTMIDVGSDTDMFWQSSWKYVSPMPIPVMAYSMALFSSLIEEKDPDWKTFLPSEIRIQYERACEFISDNPNPVFNKQELLAKSLFDEARQQASQKNFDAAIETYQKIIFLTDRTALKTSVYNNLGYTILEKGDFETAIPYLQKALEIDPSASFANENLSFAFIMLGDTDTGMYYHSIGEQTGKSIKAYTYRNLAMYHQKRGEMEKARQSFQRAFDHITIPVDWLEYLYARFLFEQGETEEATVYLQMAVEKGEPRAIQWMKELNQTI